MFDEQEQEQEQEQQEQQEQQQQQQQQPKTKTTTTNKNKTKQNKTSWYPCGLDMFCFHWCTASKVLTSFSGSYNFNTSHLK